MPQIQLRKTPGATSPQDLEVTVQDKTFEYLMTSGAKNVRLSAYLDKDQTLVEASYAEIFVQADCPYQYKITKVIPGSKTRKKISLPGEMKEGEQLTLLLELVADPDAETDDASDDESSEPAQS